MNDAMPRLRKNAAAVAVVTLVWFAYALVNAAQVHGLETANDPNVTYAMCLELLLPGALLYWTPLTLAFLALARRVPLTRETWLSSGLTLAAAVATAVLARAAFSWLTHPLVDGIYAPWHEPLPPPGMLLKQAFFYSHTKILLIVFVCYLFVHLEKTHQNRVRIAELETRLTRARLDALAAQLHPHFLFNALNSIAELIHHDADAADRMLVALGGLLRYSLASPEHEITVAEETALVAQYLAIEKIRLGERLDVIWSIDPACAQALVPALMLQPLAENAIVHGIARRRTPRHRSAQRRARGAVAAAHRRQRHRAFQHAGSAALSLRRRVGAAFFNRRRRTLDRAHRTAAAIRAGGARSGVRAPDRTRRGMNGTAACSNVRTALVYRRGVV